MPEEKKTISLPHNLVLEDRRTLTLSGVSDVDSYDEQTIIVFTEMGELTIRGEQLHVNKLSLDTGEMNVDGRILSLTYTDDAPKQGGGFFSRVFR